MKTHCALAAAAAWLLVASVATADVGQVVIEPVRDNTLFQDPLGGLSSGSGDFVIAGRAGMMARTKRKRALLDFDIAASVPAGSTITGVSLTMHMRMTVSGQQTVSMHRVAKDWGEGASVAFGGGGATALSGDATWIHTFSAGSFWTNSGGDFSPVVSASQTIDQFGFYSWSGPGLVADVQSMLDTPASDHGWMLLGNESTAFTTKMFSSREFSDPTQRPLLTIDYTQGVVAYCTSGTSSSGCQAALSASGTPSATAPSGFSVMAVNVEGAKDGLYFYSTSGRQANTWGNGSSYICVVLPTRRGGVLTGSGTNGACDGTFVQDMNARWCPTCPRPLHNPGAGAVMQFQLWYRDPSNTSNQTTGMSNALEFTFCP